MGQRDASFVRLCVTRTLGWAISVVHSATQITHLAEGRIARRSRQASGGNVSSLAPYPAGFQSSSETRGARGRTRSERGHLNNLVGNYT
jgi:hypothetical protein